MKRRSISAVKLCHVSSQRSLSMLTSTADLRAQYDVRKDQGLDTFVVIDGLPVVPAESKPKLVKFLLKKLNSVGKTSEDAIFMPMNDQNTSDG
jgi:translation initiation factor 3 subunit B